MRTRAGRIGASTLLAVAGPRRPFPPAAPASAATTTINCDTVSHTSSDWTTCQSMTASAACVFNNNNGTYTMALGYTNPSTENLYASIPVNGSGGTNNQLTATNGSAANPGHISTFSPGTSTTAFTVTWSPSSKTDPVTWSLMGHSYSFTDQITPCTSKPVNVVEDATLGGLGVAAMLGSVLVRRRRVRPLRSKATAAA